MCYKLQLPVTASISGVNEASVFFARCCIETGIGHAGGRWSAGRAAAAPAAAHTATTATAAHTTTTAAATHTATTAAATHTATTAAAAHTATTAAAAHIAITAAAALFRPRGQVPARAPAVGAAAEGAAGTERRENRVANTKKRNVYEQSEAGTAHPHPSATTHTLT